MAHGGFNTIRFSIPATGLVTGSNTITFKYNKENGLSSGYRVIRLNFKDEGGSMILPDNYFSEDDPDDWTGPYTDQASIDEGKDLWYNADLWNNNLPAGQHGFWYESVIEGSLPIRAKCADCHTQDGRDLEIFSYSNKSIVERAKFHQLSEEDGEKIASYIRSLSSTANKVSRVGRPWNPPFQPGPELDGKPWEEWVAGAGLDAVLEEDADMLSYMFPNGINANTVADYFDSDEVSDWTEVPLAIQFPDWKRWLPLIHPKDAFTASWYDQTYNSWTYNPERAYEEYRAYLEGKSGGPNLRINIAGSNPTQMMNSHYEYWHNHRFFGAQISASNVDTDGHWRSAEGVAQDNLNGSTGYEMASTSIARLMAVKNFEFNHEFELMDQAPNYLDAADQPAERQWFHHPESKHVFEVPPHITGCVIGDCQEFLGQETATGQYESTNWYQMQMVIASGNGNQSHNGPVDYNYHPEFILRSSKSSGIHEPLRYYFSLNHMYQTKTWTGDINPNNADGFRIRVMGPWYFLGKEADAGKSQLHNWDPAVFPTLLDDVSPGLTNLVLEAQINQFLREINKNQNNLSNWTRFDDSDGGNKSQNLDSESKSSITNVILPFGSDVPLYADHMWWSMNEFKKLGIDQNLIDQLKAWCEEAWPNIDWDGEPNCYGIDLPTAEFTIRHETSAGANDGQIIFNYEDDTVNGGTRTNLELSIDDWASYVNVPDNSKSYTFDNLAPGKYKLWVRWGDDACENKLGEPNINAGSSIPTAEFSVSSTTITAGQNISFTDESTGNPTSWAWTFNGGTPASSTDQNPTVSYATAGTYDVSLTATNAEGSNTITKSSFITVNELVAPVAEFTASSTTITTGTSVAFTDESTNNPTEWAWTFDGGTPGSSTAQNPSVSYETAGTYNVSLTATNAAGDSTITKSGYIIVEEPVAGEYQSGVISVSTSGPTDWTTVTFSTAMSEIPIVAAGPLSYNGSDPSTLRIRNLTTTGFEIQIDEWDYLDGVHNNADDIYYIAMLPGNHDFGGLAVEAGAISVTSDWSTHSLSQSFSGSPVILAVQVTNNEDDATYQRLQNVSDGSFEIKLQEQQANTQSHIAETIHYVALDKGSGTFNGRAIEVGSTGESVEEVWYTQSFNGSYSNPGLLAHVQTNTGSDPISLRQRNLSGNSVEFLVQEEKSSDDEVGHTLEDVGWVRVEEIDAVFEQQAPVAEFTASATSLVEGESITFTDASSNAPTSWSWTFEGGSPATSTDQNPTVSYTTVGTYDVTLTATNAGGDNTIIKSGFITVNNPVPVAEFTTSTTTIISGESITFTDASTNSPTSWSWVFEGGSPATSTDQNPTVSYAVAGTYDVTLTATNSTGDSTITKTDYITVETPSAQEFASGVVSISQASATSWTAVSFENEMSSAPIIAAGPLSYNGTHQSTIRIRNVSTAGFEIQIDEWDYHDGVHGNADDIYWVAVPEGTHDFGGLNVEAFSITANSSWSTHSFESGFGSTPVLLAVQVTNNETDATYQRLQNIGTGSFDIKLQEQEVNTQSHINETIHIIALEKGTGTFDGKNLEVGTTGTSVEEVWYTHTFGSTYTNPGVLAHIQTYTGSDPVSLRQRNLLGSSVQFLVEEEQSQDDEIGHSLEEVGWVRIEGINDQNNARTASDNVSDANQLASINNAIKFYPNPVDHYLMIEADELRGNLRVVDLKGNLIKEVTITHDISSIDMQNVTKGVYFVQFTDESGVTEIFKNHKEVISDIQRSYLTLSVSDRAFGSIHFLTVTFTHMDLHHCISNPSVTLIEQKDHHIPSPISKGFAVTAMKVFVSVVYRTQDNYLKLISLTNNTVLPP